jgi:CopG family transcriptional regulator / antitoxin EndoAI
MGRTTKTITISIPPEMEAQIEELMRLEGRTRSELLREALRRYMHDREVRELVRYGQWKAREVGISADSIEDLIDADRR